MISYQIGTKYKHCALLFCGKHPLLLSTDRELTSTTPQHQINADKS